MNPDSSTSVYLRRQRRRLSGQWLGWSTAATLVAASFGGVASGERASWAVIWQLLAMLAAAGFLVEWMRGRRALNPVALARRVDRLHGLDALVESAVELKSEASPLAFEVRRAADERVGGLPVTGTRRWLLAWAAACLAGTVCGLVNLTAPPPQTSVSKTPAPVPAATAPSETQSPAPIVAPARIQFTWKAPIRFGRARGTEEVPLVLHAEANRTLKAAALEIETNGAPSLARPIPAAVLAPHPARPAADWALTLYIDETAALPFDVISYFVRAEAMDGTSSINVRSRRQFVEIAPFAVNPRLSTLARTALDRLNAMKLAQVDLFEATEELAGSKGGIALSLPGDRPSDLVRRQQELLATSDNVLQAVSALALREDAVAALSELKDKLEASRDALAQGQAAGAVLVQGRILSLLAAAERTISTISDPESTQASAVQAGTPNLGDDPRQQTPAGAVEHLARRQAVNNTQAQSALADPAKLPAIAAEQTAIARALEQLASRRALIPQVQTLVGRAADAAAQAAAQFSLQDLQAGREPAAEAEALMKRAADLQESEGRKAANAAFEHARGELKTAAQLPNPAAQAARLQALLQQLRGEIERQKQQGSAEAAQRLSELTARVEQAARPKSSSAAATGTTVSGERPPPPPPPSGDATERSADADLQMFAASLRRVGEPPSAAASGLAQLGLRLNSAEAVLTVYFERTPRDITAQRLVVIAPGNVRTIVSTLPSRAFSWRPVRWETPVGGLSTEQILRALVEGRLAIEVATARSPGGELVGRFLPKVRTGPGVRTPGSSQVSAAMPTVELEGAPDSSALLRLSTAAAESQVALAPDQSLAQTIRQLKASAAQLAAAKQDPAALARLQLAVEKARVLAADPRTVATAGAVAGAASEAAPGADPAALKALLEQVGQLATDLEQAAPTSPRLEWSRRFPPDQIDPAYRQAVQDYFETLSREATAR